MNYFIIILIKMDSIFFNFIFLLFNAYHCKEIIYNHTNEENNLFFVFTTFRHGARKTFPEVDIFGNYDKEVGALTKYGGIQHLEIGKKYRNRYSNFLNMSFDKNELYIRSSDVERTLISTEKELEGFFNKTINRSNFFIVKEGYYFMNLYHLDNKEKEVMEKYFKRCQKRILTQDFQSIFNNEIMPILKDCYGIDNVTNMNFFFDSVITSYFEYIYGNDSKNKIGNCSIENITKIYEYCVDYYNSLRGWDEYGAYMFYKLYQHIFEYMYKAINGTSKIKMMMIGGHDITVGPFMDFLDGLKIIPRSHYPHYACNLVIELRQYNEDFYLEFYYNDILKYNNTLENFKNILNNTKYSNLYNYCGIPSKINDLKKFFGIKSTINLYIFIILMVLVSILIILLIPFMIIYFINKRKKKFIKLTDEEKSKRKESIKVFDILDSKRENTTTSNE